MEVEIEMIETEVIMAREINVLLGVMVVEIIVETVAVEIVVTETVAAETVAAAEAVAVIDIQRIKLQNPKKEETLEDIEARLEVKITSQARNHKKVIKVEDPRVVEIIVVEEEEIVGVEIADEGIDYSSSVIFSLIFEKIPLSSIISLGPGRTDNISSVINPVFL